MDIGMLWYDDTKLRPLDEKVRRAVEYYIAKYGTAPNTCYVHPSLVADDGCKMHGVSVVGSKTVIKNHFWLGVGTKSKTAL